MIWFRSDAVVALAGLGMAAGGMLVSRRVRTSLRDRWTLVLALAVPLSWLVLLVWARVFGLLGIARPGPAWTSLPVLVVFWGWPVLALALIGRARAAWGAALGFAMLNAPFWLISCFICGMSVTGEAI